MARLVIDGYGQVELNNCAFRRDGRIEAQCALDSAFASAPCENGMLLAVDNVTRTVKFADASDTNQLIALNYSSEHIYDERTPGLKNFKTQAPTSGLNADYIYPRLGYLSVGDKFTTNTIDMGSYADLSAVASAVESGVYGGISTNGAIALAAAVPSIGPALKVVKVTTMPDGTPGVKFQCVKA